jgi:hypothetical protein
VTPATLTAPNESATEWTRPAIVTSETVPLADVLDEIRNVKDEEARIAPGSGTSELGLQLSMLRDRFDEIVREIRHYADLERTRRVHRAAIIAVQVRKLQPVYDSAAAYEAEERRHREAAERAAQQRAVDEANEIRRLRRACLGQ